MFGWWKRQPKQPAPVEQNTGFVFDAPPRHEYSVGLRSDVGCVREINEDNARYVVPQNGATAQNGAAARGLLVMVADGMGGHASGEVASELAVETVCREYFASSAAPDVALRKALEASNHAIHETARRDASKKGMGTTCTALCLLNGVAVSAHVGDSRLYLIRGGGIYLMSEDHSAVMELVRQGLLTPDEARRHENKNLITRALGLHPSVEVATWKEPFPLQDCDRFLLCSDGLYDLVEDAEILDRVLRCEPEQACSELIELAKQRGGHDNITVAVVHVEPVSAADKSTTDAVLTESTPLEVTTPENKAPETREAEAIS
jgi:protein phosphatase